MTGLRNALLVGVCCRHDVRGDAAFATPPASIGSLGLGDPGRRSTALHRNSPGFVGFRGDDVVGGGRGGTPWEDPPSVDVRGRVGSRESNLSRPRRDSRSINEDPRGFDYEGRYSRPPHPYDMAVPHVEQRGRGYDDRIQGGSRRTYDGTGGGRTFVETDGRPLEVEMEVWEGPNNTPTKVKMYSEDGRQRPMNIISGYGGGYGGGVTSVRNVGSMEFPIRAGVSGGGMAEGYGAPVMDGPMMGPGGMGMGGGYGGGSPRPSMARGETVQGGALKTFTLPAHVDAAQVTITSDGLPVNAKVELWGTATHVKQLAEVYNDDGQARPFAAVVDTPGGENTIAVRNTGPMEYPIRVAVEPAGMGGRMGGGGYGYGDERMGPMGGGGYGGFGGGGGRRHGGPPPPPPMDRPYLLPPPPF